MIRVAKSCRKLDFVPCGIYSDADKSSLHITHCKEALNIGGSAASESYLKMDKIINAAKKLSCDFIHPGYGFLAENLEFSELCRKEGIVFVGPSSEVMKLSGDKVRARKVASEVASIVDGDEVSNESDALNLAGKIGYPVILKAAKGGGGRGLRIVRSNDELRSAFTSSRNEAVMSFGSERVYIEKYVENPRHIEVQILGDSSDIIQLGERECSVQRRNQKLIEETPSPALTKETREKLTDTAIGVMREMGYNNAGTVEFLFKEGKFYFMEVNSRIQVEHAITEEVTGVDIVAEQLRIASGDGLSVKQVDIRPRGHAIECRINAEHPISFVPFPGKVEKFVPSQGKGIRVDTFLYPGYSIPPFYDSLVAKLVCSAENRDDAIKMMKDALFSFRISGIPTTIPFHISALSDKRFQEGNYDTSFVNEVKPFSSKEGEFAAAILFHLPKKVHFLEKHDEADLWMKSRFNWIHLFNPAGFPHLSYGWNK